MNSMYYLAEPGQQQRQQLPLLRLLLQKNLVRSTVV